MIFKVPRSLGHDLGITPLISKLKTESSFINYYLEKHQLNILEKALMLIASSSDDIIFETLTDLVRRRNEVSHGWDEIERLSPIEIKDQFIPFVKAICESLFHIISREYLINIYNSGLFEKFNTIHRICNSRILCLNSQNSYLEKGDFIAYKANGQFEISEILNIQIDGEDVNGPVQNSTDIGLLLSERVKQTYEFFYCKRDANIFL
jgi:hypothetical protein